MINRTDLNKMELFRDKAFYYRKLNVPIRVVCAGREYSGKIEKFKTNGIVLGNKLKHDQKTEILFKDIECIKILPIENGL